MTFRARPIAPDEGVTESEADGAASPDAVVACTVAVAVEARPPVSLTVTVIVYVPGVE